MPKWLSVLLVLQTVLLVFLTYRVLMLESALESAPASVAPMTNDDRPGQPHALNPETGMGEGTWLTEPELRAIIAEESRNAAEALSGRVPNEAFDQEDPRVSAAEYQQRFESAVAKLEGYIDAGEISPGEMARLQSEIARLDETSRTQVYSWLVRAVTTGELDGEL